MRHFLGFDPPPLPDIRIEAACDYRELRDALFVPSYSALYDRHRDRIPASLVVRKRRGVVSKCPQRLCEQDLTGLRTLDRALFAGSIGYDHYGHFITEQIARLWPLLDDRWADWPLLFHCGRPMHPQYILHRDYHSFAPYQQALLESIPGFAADRLLFLDHPVRIRHALLPDPAFVTHQLGATCLRTLTRRCAEAHLPPGPGPRRKKLYFSRTRLSDQQRKVAGEARLQQRLVEQFGFELCHPQELDFAAQVRLINSADVVAGTVGSALHNLLFATAPGTRLLCFCNQDVNPNYFIVDALSQADAWYLRCTTEFDSPNQPIELDLDSALRLFEQANRTPPTAGPTVA